MGYSVLAEVLRGAASVAQATGDAARSVNLAAPAGEVGTALPGTEVVAAAGELSGKWEDEVADWSREMSQHGGHLDAAAATYERAEESGTAEMHRAGGG